MSTRQPVIDCSKSWLELQPKGKKLWPEEQTEADHLYFDPSLFPAEKQRTTKRCNSTG
jgi:hypothetical protein